jgi:hypothetical protein
MNFEFHMIMEGGYERAVCSGPAFGFPKSFVPQRQLLPETGGGSEFQNFI